MSNIDNFELRAMVAAVQIRTNIPRVRQHIRGLKDQTPFALSQTLNDLAFSSKADTDKQILRRLHKPKRYTQRAIIVKKATKRKLVARVQVNDKQRKEKLLGHLFTGGKRIGKKLEGKLLQMNVLPRGHFIVPGEAAPLDASGNIRRAFLGKLLRELRTLKLRRNANESALPPGIWQRSEVDTKRARKLARAGLATKRESELFVVHRQVKNASAKKTRRDKGKRAPKPLLLFVRRATYRRRFNLPETVTRRITRDLDRTFIKRFRAAERSAARFAGVAV